MKYLSLSKIVDLYLRWRLFLIEVQGSSFKKVAEFISKGFILTNVPGFLVLVKLLAPTCEGVPFYVQFQTSTLVLVQVQSVAEFVFSPVMGFLLEDILKNCSNFFISLVGKFIHALYLLSSLYYLFTYINNESA